MRTIIVGDGIEFQWGHDPEVMVRHMESSNDHGFHSSVSMGPRPGGHGK